MYGNRSSPNHPRRAINSYPIHFDLLRGAITEASARAGPGHDRPATHAEDIGIPAVGRSDKINTAIKRNVIKM